ncbi:SIMPL domain-containing protein [Neokomagataea sp. TBRC 2177]|uniref:SIMPL domain-containing protein n=2 Tax=Neokomagataea anthophila TaxID=2826925 RepID=A0ABS5E9N7_9PROT|nr:SIMPL domain-containing protein [Neokomagataea anthophila]
MYSRFALGAVCVSGLFYGFLGHAQAAVVQDHDMTTLNFSITNDVRAPATRLTAHLYARAENASPMGAQKALNASIATAMKLVSGQTGVDAKAGSYTIDDETPEHGHTRWIARQDVTLSGEDAGRILELAGALQAQGLMLDGTDWSLDPASREALLKKARLEALEKVRPQAEENAKALGLKLLRLNDVRINTGYEGVRPMMASLSLRSAPMAPPQSSREEQVVSATVEVQAELGQ